MAVVFKITYLILLIFGLAISSVLPVEKCTLTDKACMISAVQKMLPVFMEGIPEYDVEVLDPMTNYSMKYTLEVYLVFILFRLDNGTFTGLKDILVNDVEWDIEKKILAIKYNGTYSVEGAYRSAGYALLEPFRNAGQAKIDIKNMYNKFYIHYDLDNGYVKPTNYSIEFDVKDHVHYNFTNLFNGDEPRSQETLKYINENWKQIFVDFGIPLVDSVARRIYKNIAAFLEKVPIANIANF